MMRAGFGLCWALALASVLVAGGCATGSDTPGTGFDGGDAGGGPDGGGVDAGPTDAGGSDSTIVVPGDDGGADGGPGCTPRDEECNGEDDDCDDTVDENPSGTLCSFPDALGMCVDGTCTLDDCEPGFADCDSDPENGCETSTDTVDHCGGCDMPCDIPNASETCESGSCELDTCDEGFGDCNDDPSDGCETPLTTLTDCGACGESCDIAGSGESCATGSCEPTECAEGFGDCNDDTSDGCETPLDTLTDCGGCDVTCDLANASESCSSGTCELGSCNGGFDDCDGLEGNGCETPLNTTSHCGECGRSCSFPDGTADCVGGACVLDSCNTGFDDCDGNETNGCELDHATAVNRCATAEDLGTKCGDGSCGTICPGSSREELAFVEGNATKWYKVRIEECSSCPSGISHVVSLDVPGGIDWDMSIYTACGTRIGPDSNPGAGSDESFTISKGDSSGSDDSFDYWIEVRYVSGHSCTPWALTVQGTNC